jgi:formate dehydrogenase (coenzyme F420) beta subunit
MLQELRSTCRRLLEEETVRVVIGYGQHEEGGPAFPIFVTRASDTDQLVFNADCHHNLVTYLTRPEIRAFGKAAIIVKACDERALVVLQQESQVDRQSVVVVGVSCAAAVSPHGAKCDGCDQRAPRFADMLTGDVRDANPVAAPRYERLEAFLQRSPEDRMKYWQQELSRCTRCYACRQVCPLCYCRRCIADKNRPVCIDSSPTLQGNFSWHITRAFHLAARCVGCDACTQACPAGIDLSLLNQSLTRSAEKSFGYRSGQDASAEPLVGSYRTQDQESFIQ